MLHENIVLDSILVRQNYITNYAYMQNIFAKKE